MATAIQWLVALWFIAVFAHALGQEIARILKDRDR